MNARNFLSDECSGSEMCCSCGLTRAEKTIKKAIKTTFTDFTQLITNPSLYICDSCLKLYNDKNMRFKPIFSDKNGSYKVIDRSEVIHIIKNPPAKFVLSVPYSFKKHHWLYAGISNNKIAKIGTDDRTVIVDYSMDIAGIISHIQDCINYGIPRNELIAGHYSTFTISKFPFLKKIEKDFFEKVRPTGFVELIVKYTPAVKKKLIYESEEEGQMISKDEKNAVNLLSAIAIGSSYRAENGLQFWDGFFERRINRFKDLEAHEFISKLAEAVGTNHNSGYQGMVVNMNESDLNDMMSCIRNKTHLIVSIVYSERKKD